MNTLFRLAAFRALAPDDGAGDGAPAPASDTPDVSPSDLYDAALSAAEKDEETVDIPDDPETPDEKPDDAAKTEEVADAPEVEDDAVRDDEDEPTIPKDVLEKYPEIAPLMALEAGLSDVTTAPQTLRNFVESVAAHHGLDPAQMLGFAQPARDDQGRFTKAEAADPTEAVSTAPLGWQEAGFDSEAEYNSAPDWQKAGFDSPGEFKLAQQLEALQKQVAPVLDSQKRAAESAAQAERMGRFEAAVTRATPAAISNVKAEVGWEPTTEQVMAAAKRFPQLASESLSQAVMAAHPKDIAAHAAKVAKGGKPKPLEMPQGNQQPGRKPLTDDDRTNPDKLADRAWETVGA